MKYSDASIRPELTREGVQRRHDPRKNDLRTSGFAELPPGPAKLVSQPQWRHQAYRHSVFSELIWIFCPSIFLHEYNKQSCPERMRLQRLMEFKSFLHFRFPDLFMTRVLGFLLYSRQEFQVSCSIQDKSFRFPALFRTRVSGRCFPMKLLVFNLAFYISLVWFWSWIFSRVENFRMVDIGINAWSSHFVNLKINIILQDYFKCLRTCTSQSVKSEQPRTEISSLEKTINGYPRRELSLDLDLIDLSWVCFKSWNFD